MCKRINWMVCLIGFVFTMFLGSVSAGVTGPGSYAVPASDIFTDACKSSFTGTLMEAVAYTGDNEFIGKSGSPGTEYISMSFDTWHTGKHSPCMTGCKTDNRYTVMVNMLMLERLAAIPIGGIRV